MFSAAHCRWAFQWFSWYCSSCFDSCCDSFPRTYNYWGSVRSREFSYTVSVRSRECLMVHSVYGQALPYFIRYLVFIPGKADQTDHSVWLFFCCKKNCPLQESHRLFSVRFLYSMHSSEDVLQISHFVWISHNKVWDILYSSRNSTNFTTSNQFYKCT